MRPVLVLPSRSKPATVCALSQQPQKSWFSFHSLSSTHCHLSSQTPGPRRKARQCPVPEIGQSSLPLPWLFLGYEAKCLKKSHKTVRSCSSAHQLQQQRAFRACAYPAFTSTSSSPSPPTNTLPIPQPPPPQPPRKTLAKFHPRSLSKNTDMEALFQYIKESGSEQPPLHMFKLLRSALYHCVGYSGTQAWRVYTAMQTNNVEHLMQLNNYAHLMNLLKFTKHQDVIARMFQVLEHMQKAQSEHRFVIPSSIYGQILYALKREKNVEGMCQLMERMSVEGVPLQTDHYTLLALTAKEMNDPQVVQRVAAFMIYATGKDGMVLGQEACSIIVHLLSRLEDTKNVVSFLHAIESSDPATMYSPESSSPTKPYYDTSVYTSLMANLARHGDDVSAKQLMIEMIKHGVKPNDFTYSSLIEAHAKAGNFDAALRLFRKNLTRKGNAVRSNVALTSIITNAMRQGQIEIAEDCIERFLKASGLSIQNIDSRLRTAILWVKVKRDVKEGQKFFDTLYNEHRDLCNDFMVNHLVTGYGNERDIENVYNAFSVLKTMSGNKPSSASYHHLTNAMFKCQDISGALMSFGKLRSFGMPDDITLAMVVHGLVNNKEGDVAWRLFKAYRAEGFEPSVRAYTSMLKAFSKRKLHARDGSSLLTRDLLDLAGIPNYPTKEFSPSDSTPQSVYAYDLFTQMTGYHQPNAYTYTTLISCFSTSNMGHTLAVYRQMLSENIMPTVETYTSLVQCCAVNRDAYTALNFFKEMRQLNVMPNRHTWRYLLKAMLRSRMSKSEVDQMADLSRVELGLEARRRRRR
ncbi:hypothetical protein BDF14DRAFT_1766289 [Spinellus fusiger]|nr:hypothetical protein BDF14DRAFT_1766289 [Spinellus fusiger]